MQFSARVAGELLTRLDLYCPYHHRSASSLQTSSVVIAPSLAVAPNRPLRPDEFVDRSDRLVPRPPAGLPIKVGQGASLSRLVCRLRFDSRLSGLPCTGASIAKRMDVG
jgi:hypothetical protein